MAKENDEVIRWEPKDFELHDEVLLPSGRIANVVGLTHLDVIVRGVNTGGQLSFHPSSLRLLRRGGAIVDDNG